MRSNSEIIALVEQLLRSQPRNALVIEVCNELRKKIVDQWAVKPKLAAVFDKRSYQREYMRRWRQNKATQPSS